VIVVRAVHFKDIFFVGTVIAFTSTNDIVCDVINTVTGAKTLSARSSRAVLVVNKDTEKNIKVFCKLSNLT